MIENQITSAVIDAAVKIHRKLGPGLLESVYETVLAHDLERCGLIAEKQKPIAIKYDELSFPDAFRVDLVVESRVLVELKSVENLHPIHSKQLLTYLRLSGLRVGLLINFNVSLLKDGINRVINGYGD